MEHQRGGGMGTSMILFVPGGVIFFLKLIQVNGDFVSKGREFLVTLVLQRAKLLILKADGIIHGRKVVQNQKLFEIGDQLHQRLTSTHNIGCSDMHFIMVLLRLGRPRNLCLLFDLCCFDNLCEVVEDGLDVIFQPLIVILQQCFFTLRKNSWSGHSAFKTPVPRTPQNYIYKAGIQVVGCTLEKKNDTLRNENIVFQTSTRVIPKN